MRTRPQLIATLAFFVGLCTIVISCSKSGSGPSPNGTGKRLSAFSVTVVDRSAYSAILKWNAAMPLSSGDTVRYAVRLNGRTVDTNLLRLTDTIRNLLADVTYAGRVYAYSRSGDTISASFFLDRAVGFYYFGDASDNVNCINLYTGATVWTTNLGGVFAEMGPPVVANNVVYINDPGSGTWALNAKTGAKIWNSTYTKGIGYDILPSPLWVNGTLYTAMPGGICAINVSTGALIWSLPFHTDYTGTPVMAGNRLIAANSGSQTHIVAIDPATGTKVWSDSLETQMCKNPVVYKSLVIFAGFNGKVYAFKVADGSLAWTRDFSVPIDNYGNEFTSPALYQDLVIVYNGNSGYYGLNADDGSTVWNYQTGPVAGSSPAVGNDMVYFTNNNWLVGLNAGTGSFVWKKPISSEVNGSSAICVKNRVYLYYYSNASVYSRGLEAFYARTGDSLAQVSSGFFNAGLSTIVYNDTTYYLTESGMLQ